jgi:hypothetical protein
VLPYSKNIGFLLAGGVYISVYNSKVQGVLKEVMPMVKIIEKLKKIKLF